MTQAIVYLRCCKADMSELLTSLDLLPHFSALILLANPPLPRRLRLLIYIGSIFQKSWTIIWQYTEFPTVLHAKTEQL